MVMYLTLDGGTGIFGKSTTPGDGQPPPGPGYAPHAHSAVVARCAVLALGSDCSQPYVFAHEIGHQFGGNHDTYPGHNANTTPLEPWAFANYAQMSPSEGVGGARTLLSYYAPDCAPTISQCQTVLYYSNAAVYDDWFRTGRPDTHENARVISDFQATAAQYRLSVSRIFYDGFQY